MVSSQSVGIPADDLVILRRPAGRIAGLPDADPVRAGGRSLAAGTGALMWVPHLVIHAVPSAAVSAGLGECDGLAVLPPARAPAWASALAWTTSGSRGPGGRTSCEGRSRGALGRSIRICRIVSHLLGRPSHPVGPLAASPALVARLFGERYGFGSPWRVTRRCPPGGMSRRGDRSPEGATGAGWGGGLKGSGPGRVRALRPRCGSRRGAMRRSRASIWRCVGERSSPSSHPTPSGPASAS
jgi:hypothetical protein